MKHLLIISLLISCLFASCNKDEETDPCENVSCLNNGYCDNGQCVCPLGFSGVNCETPDCEKFSYGKICFENITAVATIAIILDGQDLFTLDPGEMQCRDVVSSGIHTYSAHNFGIYTWNGTIDVVTCYTSLQQLTL